MTSTHSKHGEGATQAVVTVVPGRRSEDLQCRSGLAIQTVLFDSASVAVGGSLLTESGIDRKSVHPHGMEINHTVPTLV